MTMMSSRRYTFNFFKKWKSLILIGLFFGCGPIVPMCAKNQQAFSCAYLRATNFDGRPPVEVNVLLPKFECAQSPSTINCCAPDSPATLWDEGKCCQAYKEIENDWLAAGRTLDDLAKDGLTEEQVHKYNEACCEGVDNKACCLAVKTGGDLSVCAPPVDACANLPEPFKTCCANNDWLACKDLPAEGAGGAGGAGAGAGGGGGGGVFGAALVRPEVECGCVDPEDQISKDEATGVVTCSPFNKKGQLAAKGYCQLKDPAKMSGAVVGMTKQQILQDVTTLEWSQVSGHQILKIDATGGITPQGVGGPFKGVTTIAQGIKVLDSELPPDRMEITLPFPKHDDKKNYEEFGILLSLKANNGSTLNVSLPTALYVSAKSQGGGCSGCKNSLVEGNVPIGDVLGNLIALMIFSAPFVLRRKVNRDI